MRRRLASLALLTLTTALLGCMVGETSHTLYLSPDGTVTWSVLETAFRSDARSTAERSREESEWLARGGTAESLRALRPLSVDISVLRSGRPYSVLTEARFAAVDDLAREALRELEMAGAVSFERTGRQRRLRIELEDCGTKPEDLGNVRIALTEGTFTRAEGFRLSEDRAAAIPQPGTGPCRFLLEWTDQD